MWHFLALDLHLAKNSFRHCIILPRSYFSSYISIHPVQVTHVNKPSGRRILYRVYNEHLTLDNLAISFGIPPFLRVYAVTKEQKNIHIHTIQAQCTWNILFSQQGFLPISLHKCGNTWIRMSEICFIVTTYIFALGVRVGISPYRTSRFKPETSPRWPKECDWHVEHGNHYQRSVVKSHELTELRNLHLNFSAGDIPRR